MSSRPHGLSLAAERRARGAKADSAIPVVRLIPLLGISVNADFNVAAQEGLPCLVGRDRLGTAHEGTHKTPDDWREGAPLTHRHAGEAVEAGSVLRLLDGA